MTPYNQKDLWIECAKHGIGDDPPIKTALQQLSMNPNDIECIRFIQGRIRALEVRDILNPQPYRLTNPSNPTYVNGQIRLGVVNHTGIEWGISPDQLTKMLVILGRTGGGKSTVIKAIIRGLLQRR